MSAQTPPSWYVNGLGSTSNEAAWIANVQNLYYSLEGGFFVGNWPYGTGGWYTGFVAYWTKNDGRIGTRGDGYLPTSRNFHVDVVSGASGYIDFHVTNGPEYTWGVNYTVAHGEPLAQGEVIGNSQTWMGGGQSNPFHASGYYTANGSTFYAWGSQSVCADSPYWTTPQGVSAWINGGPLN